ncbi:MAG: carboxypeptidase-like regulatory domain-containing protein [Candidatus Coatesbacteria bacterium]
MIEPDAQWHVVGSATCMTGPDVPESWTGNAYPTEQSDVRVESRMVADAGDPEGPSGPVLIARAGCPSAGNLEPAEARVIGGQVVQYGGSGPVAPIPGAIIDVVRGSYRTTVSADPAGWFRITVPEAGAYSVTASAPGFQTYTTGVDVSGKPECPHPRKIPLKAGCSAPVPKGMVRIMGTVTNANNGAPVISADVEIAGGGGVLQAKTDGNGRYSVIVAKGNTYSVQATKGLLTADPVSVSPGGDVCEATVDFDLHCKGCARPVVAQKQCDPACADEQLDGSDDPGDTVGKKGCLVTSVAMIAGTDPCTANVELTLNGWIGTDGKFVWEGASFYGMQSEVVGTSDGELAAALCDTDTVGVIARVCSSNTSNEHFVVVTGCVFDPTKNRCRFAVADPMAGCLGKSYSYLDDFDCVLEARRFFK